MVLLFTIFLNLNIVKVCQYFFHKNFAFKTLKLHRSADSRILLMNIEHDNNIITLVNVYAPNLENLLINFFKNVAKWISQYAMNEEYLINIMKFYR